ncbi:MAG: glycosyltransferase [Ignavibacterium sp.]
MIYIITIILLLIIISNVIIIFSLQRLFASNDFLLENQIKNEMPFISIIVAAKNEEKNIPALIKSLDEQYYPEEKYEVIIVDDNSTDNTFNITNSLIVNKTNFRIIKSDNKKIFGKRGALQKGIENSVYNYILITDADCEPQNNWLISFANVFNKGFNFAYGIAPFYQSNNLINKISCYENFRNSILSFAFSKLNLPYTATSRSIGFSKDTFFNLNGYFNTIDSVSGDDDLLLKEAVKNKIQIGLIVNCDSFVFSKTKTNIKDYLHQRARHLTSSSHYLLKQKFILAVWHLINLLSLLSIFFVSINLIFLFPFLVKMLFDLNTSRKFQKQFAYKFSLLEILYLQIFYEIFLIIHFINSKRKNISW